MFSFCFLPANLLFIQFFFLGFSLFFFFWLSVNLGGLRETLEEHDIMTLRGQKRELNLLMDKRDALSQSISIAQQGYNDEGPSLDDLEMSLKRV